jgi:hypothetical protein
VCSTSRDRFASRAAVLILPALLALTTLLSKRACDFDHKKLELQARRFCFSENPIDLGEAKS